MLYLRSVSKFMFSLFLVCVLPFASVVFWSHFGTRHFGIRHSGKDSKLGIDPKPQCSTQVGMCIHSHHTVIGYPTGPKNLFFFLTMLIWSPLVMSWSVAESRTLSEEPQVSLSDEVRYSTMKELNSLKEEVRSLKKDLFIAQRISLERSVPAIYT